MDKKLLTDIAKATKADVQPRDENSFTIEWDHAIATVIVYDGEAHWQGLWPKGPRGASPEGTLTLLVSTMPKVFRAHGYKRFTLLALAHTVEMFRGVGYVPIKGDEAWLTEVWLAQRDIRGDWGGEGKPQVIMVHPIGKAPSRNEQYAAWKRGKAKAPAWRTRP